VKRGQPERLLASRTWESAWHPATKRKGVPGVALVLKREPREAERLLREYAKKRRLRSGYPRPAAAHAWLGRLFESRTRWKRQ